MVWLTPHLVQAYFGCELIKAHIRAADRLDAGCARADAFGNPSDRTIKNILEMGLDQQLPLAVPMATAATFLRRPKELLLLFTYAEEVYRG